MGTRSSKMNLGGDDLGGMANPTGMDPAMAAEMQNMWQMLDEMSKEDPEKYKSFISEQMKEGQKFDKEQKAAAMKDANPSTWRIIRTKGELGQQVIVLIREHSKVEAPSWSEDRVP